MLDAILKILWDLKITLESQKYSKESRISKVPRMTPKKFNNVVLWGRRWYQLWNFDRLINLPEHKYIIYTIYYISLRNDPALYLINPNFSLNSNGYKSQFVRNLNHNFWEIWITICEKSGYNYKKSGSQFLRNLNLLHLVPPRLGTGSRSGCSLCLKFNLGFFKYDQCDYICLNCDLILT